MYNLLLISFINLSTVNQQPNLYSSVTLIIFHKVCWHGLSKSCLNKVSLLKANDDTVGFVSKPVYKTDLKRADGREICTFFVK